MERLHQLRLRRLTELTLKGCQAKQRSRQDCMAANRQMRVEANAGVRVSHAAHGLLVGFAEVGAGRLRGLPVRESAIDTRDDGGHHPYWRSSRSMGARHQPTIGRPRMPRVFPDVPRGRRAKISRRCSRRAHPSPLGRRGRVVGRPWRALRSMQPRKPDARSTGIAGQRLRVTLASVMPIQSSGHHHIAEYDVDVRAALLQKVQRGARAKAVAALTPCLPRGNATPAPQRK